MSAEQAEHIVAADFVAGRLPPAGYRAAQEHQLHCEPCRAAIAAAQTVYGQQQATDLATTLLNFTMRTILGGAKMLAPSLRLLPQRPAIEEQASGEDTPVFEPLRVLLPRVATGLPGLLGRFGAVLALTVGVLLLPTPAGLSAEGHRALAVFVFTAGVLALEPVSLPIAALMVPVAQVVLNVGTTPVVFEPFSRPVVFLILASLFLAEALRKQGLTRRLALMTLVASGGAVPLLLLGLMGVAAVLSMWVENTATAAVLIPVALTISRQVPDPEKARPLLVLLVLGIAYSASLGGMVTVMGAASNAVASGFLAEIRPWTFFDWMRYGLPAFLLIFPLTWWVLLKLVRVDVQQIDIEPVRQRVAKLGPMGSAEREVLLTLVGAALLWIGGAWIEPALGLPPTLLSAAMVAVMAIAYLAIRKLLNWEDVKGVSWGIFFIIGAGLSLGEALSRTGATAWFATILKPLVVGPPLVISMLLLVFLSALLTNIMNNTTIAAVFVPILISVAKSDPNFNAVQLVLPVTLATTFGYSLPSASGRMALIAASGIIERTDMMRNGIIMTLISAPVLALFFYALAVLGWV